MRGNILLSILWIIYFALFAILLYNRKLFRYIRSHKIEMYSAVLTIISETYEYDIRAGISLHHGINGYFEFLRSWETAEEEDQLTAYIVSPYTFYFDEQMRMKQFEGTINSYNGEKTDKILCRTIKVEEPGISEIVNLDKGHKTNARFMGVCIIEYVGDSGKIEDKYSKFIGWNARNMKCITFVINNEYQTIKLYGGTVDGEKLDGILVADENTFHEFKNTIYKSSRDKEKK